MTVRTSTTPFDGHDPCLLGTRPRTGGIAVTR